MIKWFEVEAADAMAEYDIIDREVVDRWGDGEGRAEIQAVYEKAADLYRVRVCYYRDNGQFGQSAPTLSAEPETVERVCEAYKRMAERAREAEERAKLSELSELVDRVGYERAKEILEQEAAD